MITRTRRSPKRLVAAVAGAAIGLSTIAATSPALAADPADVESVRVSGDDRYATAANVALEWDAPLSDIILASGENFPDGLAAASLAGLVDSPILLSRQDSLPTSTSFALSALAPPATATVHIVGGEAAIGASVRAALESAGYTLNEIEGADRYETAIAIAKTTGLDSSTVILATGENFPDALAAGSLAAEADYPILLTPSASLRADVKAAIDSLNPIRVVIMGGESAVSASVATEIAGMGIDVERINGANRYETAALFGDFYLDDLGYGAFGIAIVSGEDFPDALAAAPATGCNTGADDAADSIFDECGMPITLVQQNNVPAATAAFHVAQSEDTSKVFAIGGTAVISDAVLAAANAASTDTPPAALSAVAEPDRDEAAVTAVLDLGAPNVKLTAAEAGALANGWTVELVHNAAATSVTVGVVGQTATVTANLDTATATSIRNAWNTNAAASAVFAASVVNAAPLGAAEAGTYTVADFTTVGSIAYFVVVTFDENLDPVVDATKIGVHKTSSVFEPSLALGGATIEGDDDELLVISSGVVTDPMVAADWASVTELRLAAGAVTDDFGQGNAAVVVPVAN